MTKALRSLALLISIMGVLAISIGGVFIGEGLAKNKMIVDRMQVEKVTLDLDPNNPKAATSVKNAENAQAAADLISTHRRAIAPTKLNTDAAALESRLNRQHPQIIVINLTFPYTYIKLSGRPGYD